MRYLFFAIGIVLSADTAVLIYRKSITLGLYIMVLLSAAFIIIAVFYDNLREITRKGFPKNMKICFIAGMSFVILFSCFIMYNSKNNVTFDEDVLIVLGCGLKEDGSPTESLKLRLDGCIEYYSENPDCTIIVTGGYDKRAKITESESMKAYLVKSGIPENSILCEDKSENTRQNFEYSLMLLNENGKEYSSTAFVTSNFHIYRSYIYAVRSGFVQVHKLPVKTDIIVFIPAMLREICAVLATFILNY